MQQPSDTGISITLFIGVLAIAILLTAIITTFIVGRKKANKKY